MEAQRWWGERVKANGVGGKAMGTGAVGVVGWRGAEVGGGGVEWRNGGGRGLRR